MQTIGGAIQTMPPPSGHVVEVHARVKGFCLSLTYDQTDKQDEATETQDRGPQATRTDVTARSMRCSSGRFNRLLAAL